MTAAAGPDVTLVVVLWLSALAVLTVGWFLAGAPGLVVLAVVLGCSYTGPAAAADCRMQRNDSLEWKGDKKAHLGWSALTGAVVAGGDAYLDLGMSYWQQVGVAVVPGLLREVATGCGSDTRAGFSHQDNVYNVLGAMLGVGMGHGVRVLLTPRSVHIHVEL